MFPAFVYTDDLSTTRHLPATAAHVASAATPPLQQALYLTEPGTSGPVDVQDINQGYLGDCFFLSALGEIARVDPSFISTSLVHASASGGETVTLYEAQTGHPLDISTTAFMPVQVGVNNAGFAANGVNCATTKTSVGSQQEIWPQVVEEAFANLNGGYGAIGNGGYDMVAMETLTGQAAQYTPMAAAKLKVLQSQTSNAILEFDTQDSGVHGYGLVSSHAYMFDGFVHQDHSTMVKLLNPWGTDQPELVPWNRMTHEFSGLTIGHV